MKQKRFVSEATLRHTPAVLRDARCRYDLARLCAIRCHSVAGTGGERVCSRGLGAAAFTLVGSPRTVVCPGFDRLAIEEAAVIVLHEALHSAGLGERPLDPDAPNGGEINRLIRVACGL